MQNYLGSSRVPEERLNAGKSYKILKFPTGDVQKQK